MITFKSDNRILTQNSAYSYLVDNYSSSVSSITIVNTEGFSADDFILIEDFGKETAEIFRIGSVNTTTGVITLQTSSGTSTNTKFAHPESTKVYVLPYDQVRFYRTAAAGDITDETPTFSTNSPLNSWTDLDPASWFSVYEDTTNTTGFAWFQYRNSVSLVSSSESNPIPYAGFAGNTVAQIFEDFDSLLNTNELKMVTLAEKFSWLNEGLSILKNKLNLNNVEYFVSTEQTLTIVSGTQEYILPSDFSDFVYLHDGSDSKVDIPFKDIKKSGTYVGNTVHYYLRNRYIGIVPSPTAAATYKYRYKQKATTVTSLSTYLDLPDNAFYSLKDFMMYRSSLKFSNPISATYYQSFINGIDQSVQSAVKRDSGLDEWSIANWANN